MATTIEPVLCEGTCKVVVVIEPPPLSAEDLADISMVGALLFSAALVVFCLRRFLDLFSVSPHDD